MEVQTEKKQKRGRGRPKSFNSPQEMAQKALEFFDECTKSRHLPEKAGLCLALGISRETYSEYKNKPEYSDTIKGFNSYIESCWVRRLNGQGATGAIFYLKNAFKEDFKDRIESDVTSGGEKIQGIVYLPQKTNDGVETK